MVSMRVWSCLMVGAVVLSGCAIIESKESSYLRSAVGQAQQGEVRAQLGTPAAEQARPSGESRWIYRIYSHEPGSQSTWYGGSTWCDEYTLDFTAQGVLRDWSHANQFHGGELMPRYCVWSRSEERS